MNDRPTPPGLLRYLAALVYDALALTAVLFFATMPLVIILGGEPIGPGQVLYTLYLLGWSYGYFALCWMRGGRTLGMQAWHLLVVTPTGRPITASQAALRFGAGLLALASAGIGFVWVLIDPERRSWPDLLSGTRLVRRV